MDTIEMRLRLTETHLEEAQMEHRIRQRLMNQYISSKMQKPTGSKSSSNRIPSPLIDYDTGASISIPSNMQIPEGAIKFLQQQSNPLETEYTEMAAMLTATETHVVEISRLQATLAFHLVHQDAQIERLAEDATLTRDTVQRGNAELQVALKRGSSGLREMIIACILVLSLAILLIHFLSA